MPLTLSPGSGGATIETREDANGYLWSSTAMAYASHLSTGVGDPDVLQYVDATHGLPVAQQGTWTVAATQADASQLKATVDIAPSQTIAVTQDTAGNLLCTASQGGAWTVAATQSGTWNVGTVTAVTAVGSITNPVGLASGTNLVGKVAAGSDTSTIYNGTTALTPKFVRFSVSASGDNQVVAAVVGKKIRPIRWAASTNGTVAIKWRSGTTDVSGTRYMTQFKDSGGGECLAGHFETAANTALNLNLSAAVGVEGELTYLEI